MTQLRSINITSRTAVTLAVKLCSTAHRGIVASATPVFSAPASFSGVLRIGSTTASTTSFAEFSAGDALWCASAAGAGSNAYTLLTQASTVSLSVTQAQPTSTGIFNVAIPFGVTFDPNAAECGSPRRYQYSVTNGTPADPEWTADDNLVAGSIRINIRTPTVSTNAVSVCGITVS